MTASKEQMISLIKAVSNIDNTNILENFLTSDRLVITSMNTFSDDYFQRITSVESLNEVVKDWKDYVPRYIDNAVLTTYKIIIDGGLKPSIILNTFLDNSGSIEVIGEFSLRKVFLRKVIKYKATYQSFGVTYKIVNGLTSYILTEQEAKDLYNYVEEATKQIKIKAEDFNTFNRLKNYNIISAQEIAE